MIAMITVNELKVRETLPELVKVLQADLGEQDISLDLAIRLISAQPQQ